MEKYTQFRDKSTGISPFLPIFPPSNDSKLHSILKITKLQVIISSVIILIKFALILVSGLLMTILQPIGLGSTGVKLILLILGCFNDEYTVQGVKKHQDIRGFMPKKNEIYFVNFTSPLDPLILLSKCTGSCVWLVANSSGELCQVSLFKLIQLSLSGDVIDQSYPVVDVQNCVGKCVFIFAEGVTSNGKAVLPFLLKQEEFDRFTTKLSKSITNLKIKTIGIKIYPSNLVTPLSYGITEYLFRLLSTLTISFKLRVNIINELDFTDTSLTKIRTSFTNNGKFKLINQDLDFKAKQKFLNTYSGRR